MGLLRGRTGSEKLAAILCACRTSANPTISHMQYQGHHESSSWAWLDRRPGVLPGLTIVSHLMLSLSAAACYQASRSQAFSPGHLDALALVPTPPSPSPFPPSMERFGVWGSNIRAQGSAQRWDGYRPAGNTYLLPWPSPSSTPSVDPHPSLSRPIPSPRSSFP